MSDAVRQVALVTGANKGIGLAVASQLAELGWTVLLGARDESKGRAAAETLRAQRGDVRYQAIDITSADSVGRAAADIEGTFGRLDALSAELVRRYRDGEAKVDGRVVAEAEVSRLEGLVRDARALGLRPRRV